MAASGRLAQVSRLAPGRARRGLKDRFPASGMRVVPALRAGRRRIVRRGVKGPAVHRDDLRAAVIAPRVGMMASARPVSLKVALIVANALRAALTMNVAKALRAGLRAAAIVRRVGTRALVRPVSLKVALIVANAHRVALTANALKARRAGLRVTTAVHVGTIVSVRPVGLKVAAIAANAHRVALTANAVKARHAGSKAVATAASVRHVVLKAVRIAASVARARPAASKEARTAANAHPAVSTATAPRDVTKANAARSAVRARVQAVRRKAAHVASVRRGMHRIAPASAATVAHRRSAAAASAGRAATAHRAVLKASAARPSVASALSRNPSKAATAIARIVRRAHRATTAPNGHPPNVNSEIVRRVPANAMNVASGATALLAASTRHCRLPAAALATTTAPPVPTSRVARRPQPEPNATMTPMPRRAHHAAITKTHRAPCASPS